MKAKISLMLFLAAMASGLSCNNAPKELAAAELVAWYANPDNGFVVKREINSVIYEVRKKPLDLMIAYKIKGNGLLAGEYDSLRRELEGADYYELVVRHKDGTDILKHGVGNDQEYLGRIDYLSYKAKSEIFLEQDGVPSPSILYHFERSYGLGKQIVISLAFPKSKEGETVLVFDDDIFGSGAIKFRFEKKHEPKLKLKA